MKIVSLLLLLGLLPVALIGASPSETIEQTHPFSRDGRVRLSNVNGSVEIRGWERDEVRIVVVKSSRSEADLEHIKVRIDAQPDLLVIETEHERTGRWFWNRRAKGNVRYTVQVPATAVLEDVSAVNANIEITGVGGPVDASTVNGRLDVRGLSDGASLETVNGALTASFSDLSAGTRVGLSTVNGSVDLALPPGAGASLRARTVNGRVRCELPTTEATTSGRSFQGQVGDGAADVSISTVNGGITIRAAELARAG